MLIRLRAPYCYDSWRCVISLMSDYSIYISSRGLMNVIELGFHT